MRIKTREASGQSILEMMAGLIVFVPVILLLIDAAVIMTGVSANEAACRDAARAASCGPPSQYSAGQRTLAAGASPCMRAVNVIKSVYKIAGFFQINQSVLVQENLRAPLPDPIHGGPIIGDVTVQTTAEVMPPFIIRAFLENGTFEFKNTQRYPYTYVKPGS